MCLPFEVTRAWCSPSAHPARSGSHAPGGLASPGQRGLRAPKAWGRGGDPASHARKPPHSSTRERCPVARPRPRGPHSATGFLRIQAVTAHLEIAAVYTCRPASFQNVTDALSEFGPTSLALSVVFQTGNASVWFGILSNLVTEIQRCRKEYSRKPARSIYSWL